MTTPRIFAATAVLILLGHHAGAADTTLRWAPRKGETLRYVLNQSADTTIRAAGRKVVLRNELTVELTWAVKSVAPDGTIELAQTVDRAASKLIADGQPLAYDTKDKAGADIPAIRPLATLYEAIVGRPYTMRISPQGEVIDVKVPEGVAEALAGTELAGSADTGTFFTATGVKNLLAQVIPRLPKGPVAVGSTWTTEFRPSDSLKMTVTSAHTLADAGPFARIDARIDVAIPPAVPGSAASVKLTKQSGSARFVFDARAGRLAESTIRQAFEVVTDDQNGEVTRSIQLTGAFRLVR